MLNVIYHKSFKTTGKKKCVDDETYKQMLDYIEWFDSPALNVVEMLDPLPLPESEEVKNEKEKKKELSKEELKQKEIERKERHKKEIEKESEAIEKKRGRPTIKKE